jgi:hypothetical protein
MRETFVNRKIESLFGESVDFPVLVWHSAIYKEYRF